MSISSLAQRLLLPELRLLNVRTRQDRVSITLFAEKTSDAEVCPRCATLSMSIYDRRTVRIKDEPVRDRPVLIVITKRRFSCRPCKKPFTEPVPGVRKGARCTERFRKAVLWACERFSDLKSVRTNYKCSAGFLYKTLYAELEKRRRTRLYPWPHTIGIDEHFFKRDRKLGIRGFASIVVDYVGRRVFELVEGRASAELTEALRTIPGRENVRRVVLDMCDPFRSFARGFFPNATLVADKFHVLRLLNPAINRRRKEITGDRRTLLVRRLLLTNGHRLDIEKRWLLLGWLHDHPELAEVYHAKEALHGFYRIRGHRRAKRAFTAMTDRFARSLLPEIQRLRRTLLRWRKEILAYFYTRLTNGRTEGFNNKAKLVKRRAFGYRSFNNYRLRLLNACA